MNYIDKDARKFLELSREALPPRPIRPLAVDVYRIIKHKDGGEMRLAGFVVKYRGDHATALKRFLRGSLKINVAPEQQN